MKSFGFGDRSGIELPSETRGLLQAPKKWGATSILSMAIGQEVAVTPVQLVSMVSSIANGGVYMPPRVLLQSTDEMKGDSRLQAAAFHPANQLPATLPDGAHRVIKELTSAKMRMMMQGIIVEGTGKQAALNGYSAGGKTGTANKIDPATHTYSHTKLVASFAGFAPVSNPAISIAVVIDTPTAGGEVQHYGGAVSAPVFAEVAQEVLEYLGVPHDQPLKSKKQMLAQTKDTANGFGDAPADNVADMDAMFAEVNNLPADDPLRTPGHTSVTGESQVALPPPIVAGKSQTKSTDSAVMSLLPTKLVAAFRASGGDGSVVPDGNETALLSQQKAPAKPQGGVVTVSSAPLVAVPLFEGTGLRAVVEQAGTAGLRVQPIGSGLAREQRPSAGTMVPQGTEVVVRFTR